MILALLYTSIAYTKKTDFRAIVLGFLCQYASHPFIPPQASLVRTTVAQVNDCSFDRHALMTKTKESRHPHARSMTSTWCYTHPCWFQRRMLVTAAMAVTCFLTTYSAETLAHRSPSKRITKLISWHDQWCPSLELASPNICTANFAPLISNVCRFLHNLVVPNPCRDCIILAFQYCRLAICMCLRIQPMRKTTSQEGEHISLMADHASLFKHLSRNTGEALMKHCLMSAM